MRSDLVHAAIEWLQTSLKGFEAHCRKDIRRTNQLKRPCENKRAIRRHHLGSVDETQSIFGLEINGLQTRFCQHFRCWYLSVVLAPDESVANEWKSEVRKGCQISRRPDTPASRDYWNPTATVHFQESLKRLLRNA